MDRRCITVRGIVQGVGFRRCVRDLAIRLGLNGSVRDPSGDVRIDLEGDADLDALGRPIAGTDPLAGAVASLSHGRILVIKGLGG